MLKKEMYAGAGGADGETALCHPGFYEGKYRDLYDRFVNAKLIVTLRFRHRCRNDGNLIISQTAIITRTLEEL